MLISYAQNFEDIMLFRALQDVKKGFYIDVGAWYPTVDSVTKLFYDLGWQGINIEPQEQSYLELVAKRKKDVNLNYVIGRSEGEQIFSSIKDVGMSTCVNEFSNSCSKQGLVIDKIKMEMYSLSYIWSHYVPKGQTVHFLKIDVEGFEREVLLGLDWNVYRPWIVVIESTKPNQQISTSHEFEDIILAHDYICVYQDGLNNFYLSREQIHRKEFFKFPPNVFDNFIRSQDLPIELNEALEFTDSILYQFSFYLYKKAQIWKKKNKKVIKSKIYE